LAGRRPARAAPRPTRPPPSLPRGARRSLSRLTARTAASARAAARSRATWATTGERDDGGGGPVWSSNASAASAPATARFLSAGPTRAWSASAAARFFGGAFDEDSGPEPARRSLSEADMPPPPAGGGGGCREREREIERRSLRDQRVFCGEEVKARLPALGFL
jgi:hypothetical protein